MPSFQWDSDRFGATRFTTEERFARVGGATNWLHSRNRKEADFLARLWPLLVPKDTLEITGRIMIALVTHDSNDE